MNQWLPLIIDLNCQQNHHLGLWKTNPSRGVIIALAQRFGWNCVSILLQYSPGLIPNSNILIVCDYGIELLITAADSEDNPPSRIIMIKAIALDRCLN